jgi:hypothetical protein
VRISWRRRTSSKRAWTIVPTGIVLGGHQTRDGDAVDAGEHPRPLKLADVRGLAPASGEEGGLIEDDGLR